MTDPAMTEVLARLTHGRRPSSEVLSRAKTRFSRLGHVKRHVANEVALEFLRFLQLQEVDPLVEVPAASILEQFQVCVAEELGSPEWEPRLASAQSSPSREGLQAAYSLAFGAPLPYAWQPGFAGQAPEILDVAPSE